MSDAIAWVAGHWFEIAALVLLVALAVWCSMLPWITRNLSHLTTVATDILSHVERIERDHGARLSALEYRLGDLPDDFVRARRSDEVPPG